MEHAQDLSVDPETPGGTLPPVVFLGLEGASIPGRTADDGLVLGPAELAWLGERVGQAVPAGLAASADPAKVARATELLDDRRGRHPFTHDPVAPAAPSVVAPLASYEGQLSAVMEVEQELGIEIPTVGLAKQMEEVFKPGRSESILLPRNSQALFLLQRLRDEAHRFGLTYHRNLRGKRQRKSALDDIPGIGEKRRKALLVYFGSVERMRQANLMVDRDQDKRSPAQAARWLEAAP